MSQPVNGSKTLTYQFIAICKFSSGSCDGWRKIRWLRRCGHCSTQQMSFRFWCRPDSCKWNRCWSIVWHFVMPIWMKSSSRRRIYRVSTTASSLVWLRCTRIWSWKWLKTKENGSHHVSGQKWFKVYVNRRHKRCVATMPASPICFDALGMFRNVFLHFSMSKCVWFGWFQMSQIHQRIYRFIHPLRTGMHASKSIRTDCESACAWFIVEFQ